MLGLDIAYRCEKFDHHSFSRSRGMVGAHENLSGSHNHTTPLSGMICQLCAITCYDQTTYQIWTLYLHLLRRYERRYKIWKNGVAWSSYGLLKVTENGAIRQSAYEFLICPYLAPFFRYSEILVKNRRFEPNTPVVGPPLGVTPLEFRWDF